MLPSRGLARVSPGLALQNQIISRAPARSIPRQARNFGTGLRGNGTPFTRTSPAGVLSGGRIGAAGILSSQTFLLSSTTRQTRFASTGATPAPAPSPAESVASATSPEPISAAAATEFPSDFSSLSDLDGASLLNIPETIGYLHNLGLDYGWGPTAVCQWVLEHMHVWGGLPWWASIVGLCVAVRVVMAKPALVAQQEGVKMNKMRADPMFASLNEKWMMALAVSGSMPQAEMMQLRMQMNLVRERYGVKMWKMFLPMMQAPIAFGGFRLLTGMGALPVPGLETAGTLWFTDLTMPDPYMILPCISTIMMFFSIKRSIPFMSPQQAKIMGFVPWILGPISFFVTWKMTASVQLFFATTALLQYVQTTLWHVPAIRRACGLPTLEEVQQAAKTAPSPFGAAGASPFVKASAKSGMQYQAPRTVNTTATESGAAGKPDDNPIEALRDTWAGVMDKWEKRKESKNMNSEKQDATNYEKKRIREEHEKYLRRREAAAKYNQKK
ncbi:Mitochondrial inner membrane protein OXA1 [Cytospora mali]|uniref:Mitochondrial inner membrane protein OXA1 n=1 Tax=Cytospora mali TaxID=578113 RepID=A0A194W5Z3_CYTMA|nr:Mitochondrial inner membrane protein OXA1 [Valsa mali]